MTFTSALPMAAAILLCDVTISVLILSTLTIRKAEAAPSLSSVASTTVSAASFNQGAFYRRFLPVAGGQPFTCMNTGHAEKAHIGAHADEMLRELPGADGHHGMAKQAATNEYCLDRGVMFKSRGN